MADHYYTREPASGHKPATLTYAYRGAEIVLETDSGVFSRTEIDQGTDILLSALPDPLAGAVLDMGCGYGVIGVALGKRYPDCHVSLADVNQRACGLARDNARRNGVTTRVWESDGYRDVPAEERFDLIVQNPPIRAGKAVIYDMFAQGRDRLRPGGALWLVIRKQQGAASAIRYLQTLFQTVDTIAKEKGYWVLRCTRPLSPTDQREEAEIHDELR